MLYNASTFVALTLIAVAGLALYAYRKLGSWEQVASRASSRKGRGILAGVVLGCLVPVLFGLLVSVAKGAEFGGPTTIFLGLDHTAKRSPMCYPADVNERLTSNIGVRQRLVTFGDVGLTAQYTHHSCAINPDHWGYDAVGVHIEWTIP